jgi:hypothetical protein
VVESIWINLYLIHLIAVIGGKHVVKDTCPTCIMDGVFNEVG